MVTIQGVTRIYDNFKMGFVAAGGSKDQFGMVFTEQDFGDETRDTVHIFTVAVEQIDAVVDQLQQIKQKATGLVVASDKEVMTHGRPTA